MKFFKRDADGNVSIGGILGVVILVIIGLVLLPVVQDSVDTANDTTTGAQTTLVDMIPLFYILGVVLAAVLWVVHETRGMGK